MGIEHLRSQVQDVQQTKKGWKVMLERETLETTYLVIGLGFGPHRRTPLFGAIALPQNPLPFMRSGDKVAVVGGGLTSGHAAVAALQVGCHVTFVSAHGLRQAEFDANQRWFKYRGQEGCWSEADPEALKDFQKQPVATRLKILQDEGLPGTLTPEVVAELKAGRRQGAVTFVNKRVLQVEGGNRLVMKGGDELNGFDAVLDATGFRVSAGNLPFPGLRPVLGELYQGLPDIDLKTMETGKRGSRLFLPGPTAMLAQGPVSHTLRGATSFAAQMVDALGYDYLA
jgi:hypothetical protein